MSSQRIAFLDLGAQYRSIQPAIDDAVSKVLASGWYILGKSLERLESDVAKTFGVAHAVGVASGTDAIQLALQACGIGPGDEVVTVPNTAVPTVCGILATGAGVAFVDIDPTHFTMDPVALESYLSRAAKPPKAVVPVHLYGQPADMKPILELSARYGFRVIEDAAQAHGAAYRGRPVGSFGDAGCLSFYPTKNLGAYGDAGMVLTQSDEVADNLKRLRNYGEVAKNQNATTGINSRLDELQAAVLTVKLPYLESWNEARRERAELYNELLQGSCVTPPVEAAYARHVYHLYVVRCSDREGLRDHLEASGVGSAVHYPLPIHHQKAYRHLGRSPEPFPEAVRATREILSLPLYPELPTAAVREVCQAIADFG